MKKAVPDRIARLRAGLAECDLDGLVVSAPSNIFYLSGFTGSSGALLITAERALLFSDFRYRLQSREQAPNFEFVEVSRDLLQGVGHAAADIGAGRLGYESAHLTCELLGRLTEGVQNHEVVGVTGLVEDLRAIKSPDEIVHIRAAAALADQALDHMMSFLRPGATERDIALEGEFFMRRAGAEAVAFDLIVASGPRSALPHAQTSTRELQPADLVVIDMGATVNGYCSDMTRTFAVQTATEQARQIYEIAHRAQRAAVAAVRAGARCGEVDALARTIIDEAGFGDCFGHGLGHGVGVDVHEVPYLRKGDETKLAAGNVVTVEPGIYLPDIGGVRLEDLLVVQADGAETLTTSAMPPELPVV